MDGFGALVEEVEHLAGVELGTAAYPVGAGGLGGGFHVVAGGGFDLVLAALGVGEAEPGHVGAGGDEVAGFGGVGEDDFVDGDGGGAVAGVLGEVGLFEAEEIVVGVLDGEAVLDDEGLGIAAVVAEEERFDGAGFDGGDGAVGGAVAEEARPFSRLPLTPAMPTIMRTQRGRLATANCWMPIAILAST